MLAPVFFLWVLLHESAHALAVLAQKGNITEFRPYPCRVDNRWFFGRIRFDSVTDLEKIRLAPYQLDAVATAVLSVCFWASLRSDAAGAVFLTLLAAPFVDTVAGLIGRLRGAADADLSNVGRKQVAVLTALTVTYAIHLIAAILVGATCR